MKDSGLVSRNLNIPNQSGVAPDAERVVGKAAGADNLTVMRAPSKRSNLRTSIDAVDTSACGCVPEVDMTVV
jgi:hypothetical protein